MKLSFATLGCPTWNMRQIVDNARAMGFDGVEIRGIAGEHIGCDEPPESRREIRAMFDRAGLQISCIDGYTQFTNADPGKRNEYVEAMTKMMSVAKDVGCPTLRLFVGQMDKGSYEENLERVITSLRRLAPIAEKMGIKLALETHDDWCRGRDLMMVVDGVASPAVGVCWDMANVSFYERMQRTFDAIKGRVFHVHFKDAARLEVNKIVPVLPGKGDVDMTGGLGILQKAGYNGWLSFEWEKKWMPAIEEPEIALPYFHKYTTELMARMGVARG